MAYIMGVGPSVRPSVRPSPVVVPSTPAPAHLGGLQEALCSLFYRKGEQQQSSDVGVGTRVGGVEEGGVDGGGGAVSTGMWPAFSFPSILLSLFLPLAS